MAQGPLRIVNSFDELKTWGNKPLSCTCTQWIHLPTIKALSASTLCALLQLWPSPPLEHCLLGWLTRSTLFEQIKIYILSLSPCWLSPPHACTLHSLDPCWCKPTFLDFPWVDQSQTPLIAIKIQPLLSRSQNFASVDLSHPLSEHSQIPLFLLTKVNSFDPSQNRIMLPLCYTRHVTKYSYKGAIEFDCGMPGFTMH